MDRRTHQIDKSRCFRPNLAQRILTVRLRPYYLTELRLRLDILPFFTPVFYLSNHDAIHQQHICLSAIYNQADNRTTLGDHARWVSSPRSFRTTQKEHILTVATCHSPSNTHHEPLLLCQNQYSSKWAQTPCVVDVLHSPGDVEAGQRGAVHGDTGDTRLRYRRAPREVQELRVHAAKCTEGGVVDFLAAAYVELGEVLQPPRKSGQSVSVNLIRACAV